MATGEIGLHGHTPCLHNALKKNTYISSHPFQPQQPILPPILCVFKILSIMPTPFHQFVPASKGLDMQKKWEQWYGYMDNIYINIYMYTYICVCEVKQASASRVEYPQWRTFKPFVNR